MGIFRIWEYLGFAVAGLLISEILCECQTGFCGDFTVISERGELEERLLCLVLLQGCRQGLKYWIFVEVLRLIHDHFTILTF